MLYYKKIWKESGMRKYLIIGTLLFVLPVLIFAQGLYFDIGLGLGSAVTELDGNDVADGIGTGADEMAVDIGFKLGYGPIAGIPLYIAGTVEGIGHRFYDDYNYIQFNSYLIGPSLIFYPVPLLQIAGSVGHSFVANDSDLGIDFYDSESGYAYDVSAALDLGAGKHGILLGVKYFRATNTLEVSKVEQVSTMFSLFLKYAYRHK
jgi:hypothetical protein